MHSCSKCQQGEAGVDRVMEIKPYGVYSVDEFAKDDEGVPTEELATRWFSYTAHRFRLRWNKKHGKFDDRTGEMRYAVVLPRGWFMRWSLRGLIPAHRPEV